MKRNILFGLIVSTSLLLPCTAFAQDDIRCNFPEDTSSPEMKSAAAQCFAEAEKGLKQLKDLTKEKIKVDDPANLQIKLNSLGAQLVKINSAFMDIITKSNIPELDLASLVDLASANDMIAQYLLTLPNPDGIAPELLKAYRSSIDDFAAKFTEKATAYYKGAAEKADELKIETKYTKLAKDRLAALESNKYSATSPQPDEKTKNINH